MAGRPLLCVLLDINLFSWASFLSAAEFSQVIRNLMAFMNVFQSISEDCHLALFTVDSGECGLIYTNELEHERPVPADTRNDAMYFKFGALQSVLKNVLVKHESRDRSMTSKISSALSCCLSYINRISLMRKLETFEKRILLVSASENPSRLYLEMMNAIFSAQKNNIVIDCFQFGHKESPLLQQASFLSGGRYSHIKTTNIDSFIVELMTISIVSKSEQSQLTLSRQSPVDFETNCACHQKTISIGHCVPCVGRNLNLNGEQHIHGGLSITAAFN